MKKTLLIVPLNDPEAMLISEIAEKLALDVFVSHQAHGATLDKLTTLPKRVEQGGYERVIVVEMPGEKTEKKIQKTGAELVIIDHHHYTGLDRAHHPKTGALLPSSLEQFIKLMRITDKKLENMGFDPRLVRGVGIMDRGYAWALKREGYTKKEVAEVFAYLDTLMASTQQPKQDARMRAQAKKIWAARTEWLGYEVMISSSTRPMRGPISRVIFEEVDVPVPVILVEQRRNLIYVQESEHGYELFKQFGGFTYGMDRNWGYKNEQGKPKVTLALVKQFLQTHHPGPHIA